MAGFIIFEVAAVLNFESIYSIEYLENKGQNTILRMTH